MGKMKGRALKDTQMNGGRHFEGDSTSGKNAETTSFGRTTFTSPGCYKGRDDDHE